MDKPRIAEIETNVEAVLASYEKCEAGNCDGCAFEYIRRDWPPACAFYQQHSARYLLKKLADQTPRVMTLEELSALPFDTPVFIEENNDECGWNVFCDIDEENDVRFCGFKASADYYDLEEYGESWRCWTSRPTDEQREKVKWDG